MAGLDVSDKVKGLAGKRSVATYNRDADLVNPLALSWWPFLSGTIPGVFLLGIGLGLVNALSHRWRFVEAELIPNLGPNPYIPTNDDNPISFLRTGSNPFDVCNGISPPEWYGCMLWAGVQALIDKANENIRAQNKSSELSYAFMGFGANAAVILFSLLIGFWIYRARALRESDDKLEHHIMDASFVRAMVDVDESPLFVGASTVISKKIDELDVGKLNTYFENEIHGLLSARSLVFGFNFKGDWNSIVALSYRMMSLADVKRDATAAGVQRQADELMYSTGESLRELSFSKQGRAAHSLSLVFSSRFSFTNQQEGSLPVVWASKITAESLRAFVKGFLFERPHAAEVQIIVAAQNKIRTATDTMFCESALNASSRASVLTLLLTSTEPSDYVLAGRLFQKLKPVEQTEVLMLFRSLPAGVEGYPADAVERAVQFPWLVGANFKPDRNKCLGRLLANLPAEDSEKTLSHAMKVLRENLGESEATPDGAVFKCVDLYGVIFDRVAGVAAYDSRQAEFLVKQQARQAVIDANNAARTAAAAESTETHIVLPVLREVPATLEPVREQTQRIAIALSESGANVAHFSLGAASEDAATELERLGRALVAGAPMHMVRRLVPPQAATTEQAPVSALQPAAAVLGSRPTSPAQQPAEGLSSHPRIAPPPMFVNRQGRMRHLTTGDISNTPIPVQQAPVTAGSNGAEPVSAALDDVLPFSEGDGSKPGAPDQPAPLVVSALHAPGAPEYKNFEEKNLTALRELLLRREMQTKKAWLKIEKAKNVDHAPASMRVHQEAKTSARAHSAEKKTAPDSIAEIQVPLLREGSGGARYGAMQSSTGEAKSQEPIHSEESDVVSSNQVNIAAGEAKEEKASAPGENIKASDSSDENKVSPSVFILTKLAEGLAHSGVNIRERAEALYELLFSAALDASSQETLIKTLTSIPTHELANCLSKWAEYNRIPAEPNPLTTQIAVSAVQAGHTLEKLEQAYGGLNTRLTSMFNVPEVIRACRR